MHSIRLKQFKDFKREYQFSLMKEAALLKKVRVNTWSAETRDQAEESLKHLMDSKRPTGHKEKTLIYEYAIYLSGFMKDRPKTFDALTEFIECSKGGYIDSHTLAEVSKSLL